MDEMQQAHHELERLQGIITRHEGHMFALRGWMLVIVGGLLTTYYTSNIVMSEFVLRIFLLMITLLFLLVESRHVNLVEAVVERATAIEKQIEDSRLSEGQHVIGWYEGPKVSEACLEGAKRWWPHTGMTFILNQPFDLVVIVIVLFAAIWLPPKQVATSSPVPTAQPAQECADQPRIREAVENLLKNNQNSNAQKQTP